MTDLDQFERHAKRHIEEFLNPELKRQRKNTRIATTQGLTVTLAVRKPGEILDTRFTHRSRSISRLQARLEAEKAARAAGYSIIAYVVDYT